MKISNAVRMKKWHPLHYMMTTNCKVNNFTVSHCNSKTENAARKHWNCNGQRWLRPNIHIISNDDVWNSNILWSELAATQSYRSLTWAGLPFRVKERLTRNKSRIWNPCLRNRRHVRGLTSISKSNTRTSSNQLLVQRSLWPSILTMRKVEETKTPRPNKQHR